MSVEDAYVDYDPSGPAWTIGNTALSYTVGFNHVGTFISTSVTAVPPARLSVLPAPQTAIRVDGVQRPIGIRGEGFVYSSSSTALYGTGLRLTLSFVDRSTGLRLSRSLACYPHVPAIETWSEFAPLDASRRSQLQSVNAFNLVMAGAGLEAVHWMNGLDDAGGGSGPFTWLRRTLAAGETMTLASGSRSSDLMLPWFAATGAGGSIFGGVMWSGRWRVTLRSTTGTLAIEAGLDEETQVDLSASAEGPHGFFGTVGGGVDEVSAAMARLQRALRGHDLAPPVIYNTWFAYGTGIDEHLLRQEASRAAALGVEIFVVDAGWYPNTGLGSDFTPGLGDWRADPGKFPSGLRSLSDYVHGLGMKFGLWVEPERASVDNVGSGRAVSDAWVAEQNGKRATDLSADNPRAVQICFASREAERWAFNWLTALIDSAGVDYLKWDNNSWIFCNRAGHSHGEHDGPFRHLNALYGLFDGLRDRYPNLLIENCAGGGHRLDLALGRRSDLGWMDDRSAPSIRIRHHAAGLGGLFEPSYLLSFVMPDAQDSLKSAAGVSRVARSRMSGALGLSLKLGDLDDDARAILSREIATFKAVRDILEDATLVRLTDQPPISEDEAPPWDAVEYVSTLTGHALVLASQNDASARSLRVRLRGLLPDVEYLIAIPEGGPIGAMSGQALMEDGLELPALRDRAVHLVTLRIRPPR